MHINQATDSQKRKERVIYIFADKKLNTCSIPTTIQFFYLCRFILGLRPFDISPCSLQTEGEGVSINSVEEWKGKKENPNYSQYSSQHHWSFHSPIQNLLGRNLLQNLRVLEKVVEVEKHKRLSIWIPRPHAQPPCWTANPTPINISRMLMLTTSFKQSHYTYHFCIDILCGCAINCFNTLKEEFIFALHIRRSLFLGLHGDYKTKYFLYQQPKILISKFKTTNYDSWYWDLEPITSHVDRGETIPVFGRTQYFLGFVVFT